MPNVPDVLNEPLTQEDIDLVNEQLAELKKELDEKRDKEIRSGM